MGNALDTKLMADNTTRSHNRLTSLRVKRAKRPGMYADGGSLYLRVAPGGSKQWIFRYTSLDGRMRDMSLGAVHTSASQRPENGLRKHASSAPMELTLSTTNARSGPRWRRQTLRK